MKFFVFTDIDGTLLNHKNYSYGDLKKFIKKIKNSVHIIFNTSKTFNEIKNIQKQLDLNFPFIAENGACIFFPDGYLNENLLNKKFFKYKKSIGYKLTKLEPQLLPEKLRSLRNKYNFSFLSELNDKQILKITNLNLDDLKNAKKRLFTNPIYWHDSKEKIFEFKSELYLIKEDLCLSEGGRFLHVSDNYNKGSALKKFLSIIEKSYSSKFTTVSLGDSENDLSMLESTDYSCIVKGEKSKISLKKKNNIYYSETKAPEGWQESMEYVFEMEKYYF
jgi:mannosyl-3-phosphoglycerate phosphatase